MTIFDHLSIGRTAMRAFRLGMNVAGYNVANANTPGFSRQRIELGTLPAVDVPGGSIGQGVDVVAVHRIRDPFLDFATRRETGRYGADASRAQILGALEPTFGEVDTAPLRKSLTALFNAFETLATQPDNTSLRQDAISAAQNVAATIRSTNDQLVESQRSADGRARAAVDKVNELLGRLKDVNVKIATQEGAGGEASDLRDTRDKLIDQLSSVIAVRTVTASNGQVNVYLDETGDPLLTGSSVRALTVTSNTSGFAQVRLSRSGEVVDLTKTLRGGELGGLIKARDEDIAGYVSALDGYAGALVSEFNAVHKGGFDLYGVAGLALFQPDPPGANAAAAIQVNASIAADPRLLAVSGVAGEAGNNANALAFGNLRSKSITALSGRTLIDETANLLAQVGHDNAQSGAALEASQAIVDSLDQRRQQQSGVSLDEEAANLTQWQQSFEAAAKFMQTVNRMTEEALAIFGN